MVERRRRRQGPFNNAKREPEYIYHWNRIIGVLFALVLVIGLLGYGVHIWLTPSPPIETPPPRAEKAPEATLEKDPVESPVPPTRTPAKAPAQPLASPAIPEPKDAEPAPLEVTSGPAPEQEAPSATDPEFGHVTAVPATAEQDASDGPARSQDISIPSAAVKRFSLAQSVVNREPRGHLDDITYNAAGFTSVSAFSEVIGLNGEVLHYRWLQEGAEVAVVRVRVGANRWRSHSTKRIDRGMEGPWRVELLDSKRTLLGSIDFVF